jgi:hypothetical protein
LKTKDQKNAKEIEQQMKRLVKLQENITHLKGKLGNHTKVFEVLFIVFILGKE